MSAPFDSYMARALIFDKPDGYSPYAAGSKMYGGGRMAPNQGPVSPQGMLGYQNRDKAAAAKKQAYLERMQAEHAGNYASAAFLRGLG